MWWYRVAEDYQVVSSQSASPVAEHRGAGRFSVGLGRPLDLPHAYDVAAYDVRCTTNRAQPQPLHNVIRGKGMQGGGGSAS